MRDLLNHINLLLEENGYVNVSPNRINYKYVALSYAKLCFLFSKRFSLYNADFTCKIENLSQELGFKTKSSYLSFLNNNRIIIENSFHLTSLFKDYSNLLYHFINETYFLQDISKVEEKVKVYLRLFYPEDEILYFFTNHRKVAYAVESLDQFYPFFSSTYSIKNQKDNEYAIDILLNIINDNKVILTKSDFFIKNEQGNKSDILDYNFKSKGNIENTEESASLKESMEENLKSSKRLLFKIIPDMAAPVKREKIHLKEIPKLKNFRVDNINKKLITRTKRFNFNLIKQRMINHSDITIKFINSSLIPPVKITIEGKLISFSSVSVSYLRWLLSHSEIRDMFSNYIEENLDKEIDYFCKLYKNEDEEDIKNLRLYLTNFINLYTNNDN